jgi:hypothetical protein
MEARPNAPLTQSPRVVATLEAYRSIDIRDIAPSHLLKPGLIGTWRWFRAGEKVASVHFRIEGGAFVLTYPSGIGTEIRQRVPLIWTGCALGGRRPWFRCCCGRPGGDPDVFSTFPPKPPGMHWRTYDQLRARGLVEDQRAIKGLRGFLTRRT